MTLTFLTIRQIKYLFVRSCMCAWVCACVRAFVRLSIIINPFNIHPFNHLFGTCDIIFFLGSLQFTHIDEHENHITFIWTYRSVEALIIVLPSKDICSTPPECPWNDLKHIHIKFHYVVVKQCIAIFLSFSKRERIQCHSGTSRTEKNNLTTIYKGNFVEILKNTFLIGRQYSHHLYTVELNKLMLYAASSDTYHMDGVDVNHASFAKKKTINTCTCIIK